MGNASILTPETLTPERIKQERLARNWQQEDLALRAGVNRASVSFWESGKRKPSPKTHRRLCALLSIAAANDQERFAQVTRERLCALQQQLKDEGADWETIGYETCLLAYCDALNSLALSVIADADGPAFRIFSEHFHKLEEVRRLKVSKESTHITPSKKQQAWINGDVYQVATPQTEPAIETSISGKSIGVEPTDEIKPNGINNGNDT